MKELFVDNFAMGKKRLIDKDDLLARFLKAREITGIEYYPISQIQCAIEQIKTYPEMNETIKDLLRLSEEPMNLYILARIEELERQVSSTPFQVG